MKKKKIFFAFLTLFLIFSCGKDDDNNQEQSLAEKLIGKWNLEQQYYTSSNNEIYPSTCFKNNYALEFNSTGNVKETFCRNNGVTGYQVTTLNYSYSVIDYTNNPNVKVLRLFSQAGGYNGGMLQKRYFIRSIDENNMVLELFFLADEFLTQGSANLNDNQKLTLLLSK
jgi:hypothetical protein